MDQLSRLKADWPKWTWRESGWYFGVASALFGIYVFLYPPLETESVLRRILIAVLFFIASSLFVHLIVHALKASIVAIKRVFWYRALFNLLEQKMQEATQAKETLLELLQQQTGIRLLEIDKVLYYNGTLYIVIEMEAGINLEIGSKLTVIDRTEGYIMGRFTVSQIRRKQYIAESTGEINALWLGYIRQTGRGETSPPPDTAAVYMSAIGGNDER